MDMLTHMRAIFSNGNGFAGSRFSLVNVVTNSENLWIAIENVIKD